MKRMHFLLLSVLIGVVPLNAAESSSGGGDWEDTLTWVDNTIPDEADEIVINGTVWITKNRSCGNLHIAEGAVLQNGGDLGWVTLTVNGTLTNDGTIRNNPENYELWLNLGGDVVNNGTWTPAKTCFTSERTQHFSLGGGSEFEGLLEKRSTAGYADTFPLIAESDIILNVQNFNGQGSKDGEYFRGVVDMDGHDLTLAGATELRNTVLRNVGTLSGLDSSSVLSMTVEDAINLDGTLTVTDANVTFNGDVTVRGTMQSGGSLGWVTVKFDGKLTNKGVIRNNPGDNELWVELYGDVVNEGTWTPAKTFFASGQVQRIRQTEEVEFTGILEKKSNAGSADTFPLVAESDIIIHADRFDGQGNLDGEYFYGTFDLASHNLVLRGATVLTKTIIKNADTLFCNDSSTVNSMSVEGPACLGGNFTVTDASVNFNGEITVSDILQNGGALGWVTLNVNAGIINNGTVRNHPDGNELWLAVQGDIVNNGTWVTKKTTLLDSADQTITLSDGNPLEATILFDALWTSGPYQWEKDEEALEATRRMLDFDTLSSDESGVYRCRQDDTYSRTITVKGDGDAVLPGRHTEPARQVSGRCQLTAHGVFYQVVSMVSFTYTLKLYDMRGRVLERQTGALPQGSHRLGIGRPVVPGTYLIRFDAAGKVPSVIRFTIVR